MEDQTRPTDSTPAPGNWLTRRLQRLRFPTLFLLTAALFLLDLLIPDLVPMVDEILLGLSTLLLGRWRERKEPDRRDAAGPAADASPADGNARQERS